MTIDERTLTRRRFAAPANVDGVVVDAVPATLSIRASFQSASYAEVERLSEGDRLRDPRTVLSDDPATLAAGFLRAPDAFTGTRGDQVVDPDTGFVYEVVKARRGTAIPHGDALVLRVRE